MHRVIVASAALNVAALVALVLGFAILKHDENLLLLSVVCSGIASALALTTVARMQRARR